MAAVVTKWIYEARIEGIESGYSSLGITVYEKISGTSLCKQASSMSRETNSARFPTMLEHIKICANIPIANVKRGNSFLTAVKHRCRYSRA